MNNEEQRLDKRAAHRRSLLGLLGRVTVYYAIVAGLVALLVSVFPDVVDELPIGGMSDFYESRMVTDMEEAFLSADDEEVEEIATQVTQNRRAQAPQWVGEAVALIYAMTSTIILMIPVAWVYKTIHRDSIYDHSLDETALVLPTVVAGIVTVVQHSLALAFSLAGIVAGVRFRRALSDTFDTLFILASIGVGIAAGIKAIETAVVLTVFFNYATIAVYAFGDGLESQFAAQAAALKKAEKAAREEVRARENAAAPTDSAPGT